MRLGFWLSTLLALALCGAGPAALCAQEPSAVALAAAMEEALVKAIARAEGSVVAIARVHKNPAEGALGLEDRPDAFGRRIGPPEVPKPTDPDFIPTEFATGVVVDPAGLILTAYHVLAEDSDYYVTTQDRKVYRAWIKAADPRSDLAVLAIEATDLAPIRLGDAAKLKKGRIVIALGNPYAIARDGQPSASWGIVANLARKAPAQPDESDPLGKGTLHHFGTLIQTDARLNLGTSGGALVNLQGEMVGLTTSLAASAGYETAAGYAIPVDETFRRVLEILKQGREAEYGYLGIRRPNYVPYTPPAEQRGVRVQEVVPGTPAQRAGLRPGDVITRVGGVPIHDFDGLVLEVGKLPLEATARLSVVRDGRRFGVDVTLTKYPVRGKKIVTARPDPWRGMRVDYPTAVIDSSGRPVYASVAFDDGVAVTEVQEGSSAWKAGVRPGMLVSHVGRTAVRNPRQFRAAVMRRAGPVDLRLPDDPDNPVRTVAPGS